VFPLLLAAAPVTDWATVARGGDWASFQGLPHGPSEAAALAALGVGTPSVSTRDRLGSLPATRLDAGAAGPPAREQDGRVRREGASTTERVWPAAGLSLTIAESYDSPPAFAPTLVAALLFAPTDLGGFAELGGLQRGGPSR
jgi:hypothetical protein